MNDIPKKKGQNNLSFAHIHSFLFQTSVCPDTSTENTSSSKDDGEYEPFQTLQYSLVETQQETSNWKKSTHGKKSQSPVISTGEMIIGF